VRVLKVIEDVEDVERISDRFVHRELAASDL
jgi:hypothetical protein